MSGSGAHRVVEDDNGKRADGVAAGLHQIHLGDFLLERAAREDHAEGALLELAALFPEPLGAGILPLVVAPDAVISVIERAGEIRSLVGQGETVARTAMRGGQLEHRDAVDDLGLDWNEAMRIDLARQLEQHPVSVPVLALRGVRRPGGVLRG